MPIERGRVLVFENLVKPPCFSKEGMRLCNWGLLVRVTVHLEGRLYFGAKEEPGLEVRGKIRKERWG